MRKDHLRQVDRECGATRRDEAEQLVGYEVPDLLLRLLCRAADVGGEDDVVEAPQRGLEGEVLIAKASPR